MERILVKQFLLTGFLEYLLLKHFSDDDSTKIEILTPKDCRWRGCQLSLVFNIDVGKVHKQLEEQGVVVS
jgi:kynureninase